MFQATEETTMQTKQQDPSGPPVCSFPLCSSVAEWFTDLFGGTEYYCDRHKPMIPQAFLKKPASAVASGSNPK